MAEGWLATSNPHELSRTVGFTLAEGRRIRNGQPEYRVLVSGRAAALLPGLTIERHDHRRGGPSGGYHGVALGREALLSSVRRSPRAGHVVLGRSREGRDIDGAWFGQAPDSGAAVVRVLGAHHGDEWSSFEVALALADALAMRDGIDPGITDLLDTTTVWVVPYVNPDGVAEGSRYNAAGIDLNRNYSFQWDASAYRAGNTPFSEPETRAIREHTLAGGLPMISLTLHSGAVNIGYVWNFQTQNTPEETALRAMANDYAALCDEPGFWVTNGAAWYTSNGDTNDWSYGNYGGMDFTVELTQRKAPPASDIDRFVDAHLDATLAFLVQPPTLSGHIVDTDGDPVQASVTVVRGGSDASATFFTDPGFGRFARVLSQGKATLMVEAPGHRPKSVEVDVGTDDATDLVIRLSPKALASDALEERAPFPGDMVTLQTGIHETATLVRPGHAALDVTVSDGRFQVPLEAAPGPWTLVRADGTTHLRALVVQSDEAFDLDWTLSRSHLDISGRDLAPGTRAWALYGKKRLLQPLSITGERADSVEISLDPLPRNANWDLALLSNGTWTVIPDLYPGAIDQPDEPLADDRPQLKGQACGCATGRPLPGVLPALLLLLARRRS